MTNVTTSLKLDAALKDRVQRLSKSRRRSAHWLMCEAVAQYLEREEAADRMRHDAVAAWEAYQATGRHATAEEVDAWMAALEAGEDAAPPECHG